MISRKAAAIPAPLEAGRRRFERWRRTCPGYARIPEPLWALAVKLAEAYGLGRTARMLGLDYHALKKRLPSADPHDSSGAETATAFVELVPAGRSGFPECLVELEDPRGAKMRIHLKGATVPDLAALSRSFWSVEG